MLNTKVSPRNQTAPEEQKEEEHPEDINYLAPTYITRNTHKYWDETPTSSLRDQFVYEVKTRYQ